MKKDTVKLTKALAGVIPLVLLLGCGNPADNVPSASTGKASGTAKEAGKTDPEARYFTFGPEPSTIEFIGSKVTRSHNGGFKNFRGEFKVLKTRLADKGNKVVIDTSSLWADDNRLTGHLKSPDFFNVAQFPTATFVSTAIDQAKDPATVTGDLTLHGVTKAISFPAKIQINETAVQVTAEFSLNRLDFGIVYPGMANDLIRKEVVLKLNVKAAAGRADFSALEQAAQAGAASSSGPKRQ